MLVNYILYFILVMVVLVSVAFITLFERKILGYVQYRKGPNKVGFMGLMQPFSDAVKLLFKEGLVLTYTNFFIFIFSPCYLMGLMLLMWMIFYYETLNSIQFEVLYFMLVSSFSVYGLLGAGWSSNSKFALLGAYRSFAQMISYEVGMSFLIICVLVVSGGYVIKDILYYQEKFSFMFGFLGLFIMWLVTILAETNRTPFDFSESESELVSGFNVEYGGVGFIFLFLAEYGNIIFMSVLTSYLFMGGVGLFFYSALLVMSFYLFMRGTVVRYRYDLLMYIAWKSFLPFSILMLLVVYNFF
uniref:NADH-ubiquinone oxidoreductase chain 1 n=1 Tax=Macrocheles muscaedomesticae TaxID=406086 RepID=A0A6B9WDE3_9ACAR|nr:NADH dehydrogenase subunit 1 [Macrocheles muscaedomesticae]QHQ98533.1 NADH dehydrogenase subunit 1 [Macrocheles muscaedomesticae]